jgi:predicted glycoside hydrolase/deacetylase ChbG (UPF0249 family)
MTRYANVRRRLIVNADDFGMSVGINAGITEAHERGIVTSTSLMVRWPSAPQAARYARARPSLGVGLHLDIGEWVYRDGEWCALYRVVAEDDAAAVEREALAQLDTFRQLIGCDPTHLDSHQHVHRNGHLQKVAVEMARELGVPLRGCVGGVNYVGDFYGQSGKGEPFHEAITAAALAQLIRELPAGDNEIGCHAGHAEPDLATSYRVERAAEVAALCNAQVRRAVEEERIELCNFKSCRLDAAEGIRA